MKLATSCFTWSTATPRAFATRAACRFGVRRADVRIETGGRGGDGVRRDRRFRAVNDQRRLVVVERLDQLHVVEIALGVLELIERHRRLVGNVVVEAVVHDAKA